jgi:hypothetical protein
MQRPDLTTLACVNADCQQFGRTGQDNLTIRKVYGKDGIRLLRCGKCLYKNIFMYYSGLKHDDSDSSISR